MGAALSLFAAVLIGGGAGTVRLGPEEARGYGRGFVLDGGEFVVDNGAGDKRGAGVMWTLRFDGDEPAPFTVRTEAKCEQGPGGSRNRGFSLYLDVTFADGDHLWGETADFAPDPARGWRRGRVDVIPVKPVRSVNVYCLYRSLPGRARFRPPEVERADVSGAIAFDSGIVAAADLPRTEGAFLVRDVGAGELGFRPLVPGGETAGLRLAVDERRGADGARRFEVELSAPDGRDRAVTLVYALPLPPGGLVRECDPRTSLPLAADAPQCGDAEPTGAGAGGLGRWPFGAVTVGGRGFALGIDTAAPAYFRTLVNPRLRLALIAFDLGLAAEKRTARFAFRSFGFTGGFRGALAAYAALEPEAFRTRVSRHGVWMPFAPISAVKGWEDFGFAFKEGDGESPWDDRHGVLTFRYTEPTTWWMKMDRVHGTNAFTLADCRSRAAELVAEGRPYARAWSRWPMRDEDGVEVGSVKDTPWCRGAIWLLSPLPALDGDSDYAVKNPEPEFADAYRRPFPEGRDGEYIDSAEGYLTPALDFNRAVFHASETPLVFLSGDWPRPAVFKGLAMYEYVRRTAGRVWPRGRFTMANGIPGRWPWMPAYVDVGGTETAWIDREGRWRPEPHASLIRKRALSMGKPYCYLMNVDFSKLSYADMENFMRHCTAYGFFPGCFSHNASEDHYFKDPKLYDRDRPLFRKYVPLCRKLSEAGWRPQNGLVAASDPRVFVERFGERLVTVFNSAAEPLTVTLSAAPGGRAEELVEGAPVDFAGGTVELRLAPDAVRVLEFAREGGQTSRVLR